MRSHERSREASAEEKEEFVGGLITFLVGASMAIAAIAVWAVARWRAGRAAGGRRW
jgi:hypothetical protein